MTKELPMLRLTEVLAAGEGAAPAGVLTMRFEDRRKSRLRAVLDDGREAALLLPRGTILRDGDHLRDAAAGTVVAVRAAAQTLSYVEVADPFLLTRAAYHLGNRHIPVQIGRGWLAYEHDHVLDDMVRDLGLSVETRTAPFEPEAGGYRHAGADASHGRSHGHSHGHDHGGGHGHGHRHDY
jgi:urease accessory protein